MPVKRASAKSQSRKVFGHPGKPAKAALRAGLYARVSTNDQQTLPMQLRVLREYAARRGWSVISLVKEVGSGASQRQMRRPPAARFEREVLRERVRAGLAHARQNGKRLGRPFTASLHANQVRKLFREGASKSAIARRLNIGRTSVRRILSSKKS